MVQYIHIEDMILNRIKACLEGPIHYEAEFVTSNKIVSNAAERYNYLGADFQDTWCDEYWISYNKIREHISHPPIRPHTHERLDSASLVSLGDLNYLSKSDHFPKHFSPTLRKIDEESNKFRSSSIKTRASQTDEICKNCTIV